MKKSFLVSVATIGAAAITFMFVASSVSTPDAGEQARGAGPAPTQSAAPPPRTADGKPDMTGVWGQAGFGGDDNLAELDRLYTPAARAKMQEFSEADDPLLRCLPYGVPRSIVSSPWPFQIVQTGGIMVVLTEYYHAFRAIPTDGSPHPKDMLPTYFGDSVGSWEGDTLVVDVAGFNGKTWLADARDKPTPTSLGIWFHSDALHVVERWHLLDAETLEYQAVVEDPKMLTRLWKTQKTVKRQPFRKIGEGMCFDTTTYDLARIPM